MLQIAAIKNNAILVDLFIFFCFIINIFQRIFIFIMK